VADDFTDPGRWETFHASVLPGFQIGAFFGGTIVDGRYVIFSPESDSIQVTTPLQYDSTKSFQDPSSWSLFDLAPLASSVGWSGSCVGSILLGRSLHFLPNAGTY
jgi:hypothetical protein